MRLEDAGKIYSNFINIPIIAESSKKKDSNKSQKELSKNTLICGTCFKSLPADSKFCIYCGSKIL